jgi:hypothetical protein
MILIVSSVTGDARRSECFGSDPGSGIGVLFGRNGHPPARGPGRPPTAARRARARRARQSYDAAARREPPARSTAKSSPRGVCRPTRVRGRCTRRRTTRTRRL